jgi:trans-aconitate methyltransferase
MTIEEAIAMLCALDTGNKPQQWADLGCGSGLFSRALASMLPYGSHILCMDRIEQEIGNGNVNGVTLEFQKADFSNHDFLARSLDGFLMANSLHFIENKEPLLKRLVNSLSPKGRIIIIEYNSENANKWVPHPITFEALRVLAFRLGLREIRKLATMPSKYGPVMYSCEIAP